MGNIISKMKSSLFQVIRIYRNRKHHQPQRLLPPQRLLLQLQLQLRPQPLLLLRVGLKINLNMKQHCSNFL